MTVWYCVTIWRRRLSQHGDSSPSSSSSHTLQAKHPRQAMVPTPSRQRLGSPEHPGQMALDVPLVPREGPVGLQGQQQHCTADGSTCGSKEGGQPPTVWKPHRQAFRRNLDVQGKLSEGLDRSVALPWPLQPCTYPEATRAESDCPGPQEDWSLRATLSPLLTPATVCHCPLGSGKHGPFCPPRQSCRT